MASNDLAAHLTHALTEHRRWCRTNGVAFPPALEVMLSALASGDGQQWPNFAPMVSEVDDRLQALDYKATAKRLAVSVRTVRRMTRDGRLAAVRVGKRVVIPVAAIGDLLKEKHGQR